MIQLASYSSAYLDDGHFNLTISMYKYFVYWMKAFIKFPPFSL